jgi:hypothetical protein
MITTSFDLELQKTGNNGEITTETVKVVMQEVSPFIVSDIFMSNLGDNGRYKIGSLIKQFTQEDSKVIVSPKNLVEQIEAADNAIPAINIVFREVNQFCSNPQKYVLLQKQSKAESEDMVNGNTKSNTDGNKTA